MKTAEIEFLTPSGKLLKLEIPAQRIVCPQCDGEGTELRGGLKGAVFTPEELNDPGYADYAEAMARGDYDVPCSTCKGKNVADFPDWELVEKRYPTIFKYYQITKEAEREAEMEAYYESRWNC